MDTKSELLTKQNNSIEGLLDENQALQEQVAKMLAESDEPQRMVQSLQDQLSTLKESYEKQVAAQKDLASQLRGLREQQLKHSEEHEQTLRDLALSKKHYDVQSEEKADLERWAEDMKATKASMSAQIKVEI